MSKRLRMVLILVLTKLVVASSILATGFRPEVHEQDYCIVRVSGELQEVKITGKINDKIYVRFHESYDRYREDSGWHTYGYWWQFWRDIVISEVVACPHK